MGAISEVYCYSPQSVHARPVRQLFYDLGSEESLARSNIDERSESRGANLYRSM